MIELKWEVEVRRNIPPERWVEVVPSYFMHTAIDIALNRLGLTNIINGSYQITASMVKQ